LEEFVMPEFDAVLLEPATFEGPKVFEELGSEEDMAGEGARGEGRRDSSGPRQRCSDVLS
jgi:hypothetical protein